MSETASWAAPLPLTWCATGSIWRIKTYSGSPDNAQRKPAATALVSPTTAPYWACAIDAVKASIRAKSRMPPAIGVNP